MRKFILSEDQYFEAILQLRPADEKVIDYILNQIKKTERVYISKEIDLKTGIDLYLSDQRFAINLGRKLKRVFKGKLITTRKLFGYDKAKGKKIYRVTVLFRLS